METEDMFCEIPRGMDNYWFKFCNIDNNISECQNCKHYKKNRKRRN